MYLFIGHLTVQPYYLTPVGHNGVNTTSFTDGVLKGDEGVTYMYVEKGNLYHTIDSANRTKNLVYVHADKNTNTRPSSLKWTIPNVLSGDYYVGAVIVPKFIDQTEAVDSSVHTSAPSHINLRSSKPSKTQWLSSQTTCSLCL